MVVRCTELKYLHHMRMSLCILQQQHWPSVPPAGIQFIQCSSLRFQFS